MSTAFPDEDLRCENFTTKGDQLFTCVGAPVPTDGVAKPDGFYATLDGEVWVCDYHRFIDLTGGVT